MSENNEGIEPSTPKKKSFFRSTAFKASAATLGGALLLGSAFSVGAAAATKGQGFAGPSFGHQAAFANSAGDDFSRGHGSERMGIAADGHRGNSKDHGRFGGDHKSQGPMGIFNVEQDERLDALNEFLENRGLDPVTELPEELQGSSDQLKERFELERLNQMLEKFGLDEVTELPSGDDSTNS